MIRNRPGSQGDALYFQEKPAKSSHCCLVHYLLLDEKQYWGGAETKISTPYISNCIGWLR